MNHQFFIKFIHYVIKTESRLIEILRFGVVGVLATVIHYGLYILLIGFVNPNWAYSVGFAVGFVSNFFLSSYFTFKTKPSFKKGIGFAFSQGLNYVLQMGLLNLFLWLKVSKEMAPIPVFILVIPLSYIMARIVLKSDRL